ncbi:hypothetical protein Taro_003703, partial [Colocasia esculenta]|nr:hypothetical protein [Colocasia esculenta]
KIEGRRQEGCKATIRGYHLAFLLFKISLKGTKLNVIGRSHSRSHPIEMKLALSFYEGSILITTKGNIRSEGLKTSKAKELIYLGRRVRILHFSGQVVASSILMSDDDDNVVMGKKLGGCSWIEVKRKVYTFLSINEMNPQIEQLHALILRLAMETK